MDVKLVVVAGKHAGKEIPLRGQKFLIGRGEECQLRPQSTMVSRKHCLIRLDGPQPTIEDCHSTNGTIVNQERLSQRCELKDGDRVKIGMFEFEVRLTPAAGIKPKRSTVLGPDDVDISNWLGPTDQMPASNSDPPASLSDTMAAKSMVDTAIAPAAPQRDKPKKQEGEKAEPVAKPEGEKGRSSAKLVGKPRRPARPVTENSGEAAADMLRQFFHRKKP